MDGMRQIGRLSGRILRQYPGMVMEAPDFTEADYEDMCRRILGVTKRSGYSWFSEVFAVGDDGERQLLLEGTVERQVFYTQGDGYTTERASWTVATIRLECYECRKVVYPSRDNPCPDFLDGDLAECDFNPQRIDGFMREE